jgi:hypothetical protein
MRGMIVGQVLFFASVCHKCQLHPCAFVEWFLHSGDEPDPVTGMWIVQPKKERNCCEVGFVHLDCIVCRCQLIGVYGDQCLAEDFQYTWTLDLFCQFYVNRWVDYHGHEVIQ